MNLPNFFLSLILNKRKGRAIEYLFYREVKTLVAIIVISILVILLILALSIAAISKGYSYKHTVDTYNYDNTPQTPPHLKNKDEKHL
jgi:hypothetical protein